jgi:hypothetical protein
MQNNTWIPNSEFPNWFTYGIIQIVSGANVIIYFTTENLFPFHGYTVILCYKQNLGNYCGMTINYHCNKDDFYSFRMMIMSVYSKKNITELITLLLSF